MPNELKSLVLTVENPCLTQLLKGYKLKSKILSTAYQYSAKYYSNMSKWLSYPLIVTSALNTVLSGLKINNHIILGLSLISLILIGFNSVIDPKRRENLAHNISIEFEEITENISEFMILNKTSEETKTYSKHILNIIQIWNSQSPNIREIYIKRSKLLHSVRVRPSLSDNSSNRPKYNNFKTKD